MPLNFLVKDIIDPNMSLTTSVKQRYGRRLSVLQRRLKGIKGVESQRKLCESNEKIWFTPTQERFVTENQIASPKYQRGESFKNQDELKQTEKKKRYVRLFVSQLKKSCPNTMSDKKTDSSEMTREIDKLYNTEYKNIDKGWKGIKSNKSVDFTISVLTALAILTLHFLAAFQLLFQDYRDSQYTSVLALSYACLGVSIIKIMSSFILITIAFGKKLDRIRQISLEYITSSDFYLDTLVFVSAVLLIALPHSQIAAGFAVIHTVINVVCIGRLGIAIDVHFLNTNTKKQIFALLKLLSSNFFVVHFMATLLIGLALVENRQTWLDKYGIDGSDWWTKYIYGLYWSAVIMVTVGFGDITVSNEAEAAVLVVMLLIGCLILSYNIAEVSNIINSLTRAPNQMKQQLAVLRRLTRVTKIDQKLHHSISQYIIHSAEIKRTFEINERKDLVQMLPSQMRQEFVEQLSRNFCASLPFFFMLENQTQKLACTKLHLQVLSPNEYITHKRLGLTRICILRKGVVGLAYKKKGSQLNGVILDKISIASECDDPQLLNIYLLDRGKKLVYDIICQEYCVVGCLEFSDFFEALRESQKDFQLYHQSRDETPFRLNEWGNKKCPYCEVKHSIFVCPKMHYIPLRGQTFLKWQSIITDQKRYACLRNKLKIAKCNPVIFWKRFFSKMEKVLQTQVHKSQLRRISTVNVEDDYQQISPRMLRVFFEKQVVVNQEYSQFELDAPENYKYYFNKQNPNKLAEIHLNKYLSPIQIDRISSFTEQI